MADQAIKDTDGWTAEQLRERLKAAQLDGDEPAARWYARRLMRHPDRFRENREEVSRG